MALIACPDCASEVSDKAPACLKCGSPIASMSDVRSTGVPLTTTQETSKSLKLHIIGSALLMLISGVVIWVNIANGIDPGDISFFIFLFFAGLAWYAATKLRIWWHHK